MKTNIAIHLLLLIMTMTVSCGRKKVEFATDNMMVRIAEVEIEPSHLEAYKAILIEEAEASVRLESGVITIFPMFEKENPTLIKILEIYANEEAYKAHLKTPHFQHYKTETEKMVISLNLLDMDAMDKETMSNIFRKLGQ
ncbi:putative quinol monooxygenase [Sphingobacterium corticibacter]|uniref:Antibiotic biosynthesis monooxygenase n=1 Tax=Sphingobacterium corticibacter TaxID=2171749 RepID=A0A2T8HIN5_9SPHI|nr:putative quinol monooxygenase [Sphingobacterium corticibacter]PVH25304.1 antibiotic biosynthesis monooxygenase [Sphingobacterium corticibacter]